MKNIENQNKQFIKKVLTDETLFDTYTRNGCSSRMLYAEFPFSFNDYDIDELDFELIDVRLTLDVYG